jgi:PAS domain S-box-containing protein
MVESRPSILVVEDENVVAMDLVSSLERLHYSVLGVAASGEEAVTFAQKNEPGLVLMDIHLRGQMDGISAAEKIQETLFIPVVYLTAYSDEATLRRARATHAFGYVLKPFEDRELEVAIQMALWRHKMERALRDSESRLDAILGSIGEAVIATDPSNRVTFLNRAAETLLGWKSERAKGRLLSDVLKLSPHADGSLRLTRGGRDVIPVELVNSPVLDASGKPTGHVTIARDVSERLRAQEAHDRELIERAARTEAEREHERSRLKSEISLALADITQSTEMAPALRRVTDLIVKGVADWCVLHVEDPPTKLRITSHTDPDMAARVQELTERWPFDANAPRGASAVMRTGQPELLQSVGDEVLVQLAHDPKDLELLRRVGMTSCVCVPLRARQRIVGALGLVSTAASRRYDESTVTFAQQVADRVALAIDNARLFREAQDAKAVAERLYLAEQRSRAEAEVLFRIAETFAEAQLDLDALVQRVTDEATAMVGAQFGAFFYNLVDANGEAYTLYTLSGAPKEAFERFGLPRNTPMFAPTFAGQAVVRIDDVRVDPRYGKMAPHYGMPKGHLPVTSYLAVPVIARSGTVIGGLFFGHPEAARFTDQHERMAKVLATHAAVAIDNAHLFGATREAEERQGRLVRELERAVRFSELFVGILGHDLRNPLSGITTAARVVLSRSESPRVLKPVSRILNSAERMSRMIDQILGVTHVRLGQGIPLKRNTVDLADICRLVLDELKGDAEQAGPVRLEVRGDPVGVWDSDRLGQLLSNLAGNAVQHRDRGTAVTLSIDGSRPNDVTLEVHNEGAIPAEILPVIFEPLHGGEHRKRAGSSGLGLGLYISQHIAVAHGGSIRVESSVRDGTRFILALPRVPPDGAEQVFGAIEREEAGK